jgi:purine-binding chemotaxis protein CheW
MEYDSQRPDRILADAREFAREREVVDVDEAVRKLVIFSVGGALFAFDGGSVREILHVGEITYVPGSPPSILGIMNVRGDIESVADLSVFLGRRRSPLGASSRVIVARSAGVVSGVLVDEVVDVLDVTESALCPPPATLDDTKREFVSAEAVHGGRTVAVLDVGVLFEKIKV